MGTPNWQARPLVQYRIPSCDWLHWLESLGFFMDARSRAETAVSRARKFPSQSNLKRRGSPTQQRDRVPRLRPVPHWRRSQRKLVDFRLNYTVTTSLTCAFPSFLDFIACPDIPEHPLYIETTLCERRRLPRSTTRVIVSRRRPPPGRTVSPPASGLPTPRDPSTIVAATPSNTRHVPDSTAPADSPGRPPPVHPSRRIGRVWSSMNITASK